MVWPAGYVPIAVQMFIFTGREHLGYEVTGFLNRLDAGPTELTFIIVGILLLVMQRLTGASTREIVVELWPFLLIILGGMVTLILFPEIVMWLPRLLGY